MTRDRGAADASADAPDGHKQSLEDDAVDAVADAVAPETTLLGGLDPGWVASSLAPVAGALALKGEQAAQVLSRYAADVATMGAAGTGPEGDQNAPTGPGLDPSDRRFRDPAWREDPYFRLLGQGYLRWARMMDELVAAAGLEGRSGERARFAARAVVDAWAPTNFFWTNPEALRRAVETQGASVSRGLQNYVADVQHNGGRPRQVDASRFVLGKNLAATPGQVVFSNEVMELIQYEPRTARVHAVPLLVSPPWINKYYILDLSPGRSFIEWAVDHGHTVFAISYRNPDAAGRDWTLDDYLLRGPHIALDVIADITGAGEVNLVALCVGGTLAAMLAAWLADAGEQRVRSLTLLNTLFDFEDPGALGLFTDSESVDRLVEAMGTKGYLDAAEMAGTFDVLRANDLIWNYVARNWLLGESPPAFDILAWNSDSTRLPAALHEFYLRACYVENRLARGELELAGRPVHLDAVTCDAFVVAAERDHIVPWRSAYRATELLGGDVDFVLTSSGHIAGVVNPPSPKSRHWVTRGGSRRGYPTDSDSWRADAVERRGTWWETWAEWAHERGGPWQDPPPLGSERYRAGAAAPGAYVRERS